MIRIQEAFEHKKAVIAFVTAGDPTLEATKELVIKMEEKGADIIELGIPFSDSIAEDPMIQEGNERALRNGTTTDKIFDMVRDLREAVNVPIIFSSYLNPIFAYGSEKFIRNCRECGVDGIVVLDLPFEEKEELGGLCDEYGVALINLLVPLSSERVAMVAKDATGFLDCIRTLDVEAECQDGKLTLKEMVELVHRECKLPCVAGAGIITEEQAREAVQIVDGIIVESEITRLVANYGEDTVDAVGEYVYRMKQAVMSVVRSEV